MAYDTQVDTGAAPRFEHPYDDTSTTSGNGLLRMTNVAAAAVSVALIGGVGVWGYKLFMRDVTGIPVVQAATGDMRVRPEDPGGELAENQGLAVNSVTADLGVTAPADRIVLAPQPVELTEEDLPMGSQTVALMQQALADAKALEEVEPALHQEASLDDTTAAINAIVAELTKGIEPIEAMTEPEEATVQLASASAADVIAVLPGLKTSLRPNLRPKNVSVKPTSASAMSGSAPGEVDPASLPVGTRLVQLGAYDSADRARSEWTRIRGKFSDLMADKAPVVQQASSGGRVFFRLRAHGFADLSDARRFCSALLAEGADCIPVTQR